MKLRIFTDGACSGNPGPGGWAVLLNLKTDNKTLSGGEKETTNNRMELTAVVNALEEVSLNEYKKYDDIEIHSDSAYVVHAVNLRWIRKWKLNGWKTAKNDDVKNRDLWERLDNTMHALLSCKNTITFVKVKGHAGNTFNEIVDKLAVDEVVKIKEK
jgi:ribonuclease HI